MAASLKSPLGLKVRKLGISDFSVDLGDLHSAKACQIVGHAIAELVAWFYFGEKPKNGRGIGIMSPYFTPPYFPYFPISWAKPNRSRDARVMTVP